MNKELKKLLDSINAKKQEIKNLVAENKLDEAENAKDELKALQKKFDLLADLDEGTEGGEGQGEGETKPVEGSEPKKNKKSAAMAFVAVFKNLATGKRANKEDVKILADSTTINEANEAPIDENGLSNGGIVIPDDLRNEIKELRRSTTNLEELVNVESVNVNKGTRIIETVSDMTPFEEVDEGEAIPEESTPKLKAIRYAIKKFGGILKATAELLADSPVNILNWLKKYIAKKVTVTRNSKILACLDAIAGENLKTIKSIDDIKDIFDVDLDIDLAAGSILLTNQTGYNILNKLKNSNGDYILEKNPTDATKRMFDGKYPVVVVSNKVLKNVVGKGAPAYFGNLKEAVTLFDRERMTIDVSSVAGDLWKTDKTGIKVRDRFDVQSVDTDAVFKGFITNKTTDATPETTPTSGQAG